MRQSLKFAMFKENLSIGSGLHLYEIKVGIKPYLPIFMDVIFNLPDNDDFLSGKIQNPRNLVKSLPGDSCYT